MEVVIPEDPSTIAHLAADPICRFLERKPHAVLGLATGSTPLPLYAELVRRYKAGEVSFADAQAFMLDEYIGLPVDHPEAYSNVIRTQFTGLVDFPDRAVHALDGMAPDVTGTCTGYEEAIAQAGGVDLQILGIGTDGHIGFNEPGSSLASRTRVKALLPQTRRDNARFFGGDLDQVPQHSITQGLGTIMEARHILLLATGEGKARAVRELVEGPVSAMWPATILQHHPHVTVLLDEAAASQLKNLEDYRSAYRTKPDWQGF